MSSVLYLIALITGAVVIQTANAQSKPSCGNEYTVNPLSRAQKIYYLGGGKASTVPSNVSCKWFLNVVNEAYIQAKEFYLTNEDSFFIIDLESDKTRPAFGPFQGREGPFVIALVAGRYQLELQTTEEVYPRGFFLDVANNCESDLVYLFSGVAQLGAIRSPLYSPSGGQLKCIIRITGFGVSNKPDLLSVSIVKSNISEGRLNVTEQKKQEITHSYDFVHSTPPPLILTKHLLKFELTIQKKVPNQFLVLEYEMVSEGCSKVVNLTTENHTAIISQNIESNVLWLPTVCHWLINAPHGTHINVVPMKLNLQDHQDSFFISGPANSNFQPVHITSTTHEVAEVGSLIMPGSNVILKLESPRPRSGTTVQLRVSLHNDTDLHIQKGESSIVLNESSVAHPGYKLQARTDHYVKLSWPVALPDPAVLLIYNSFSLASSPYLELSHQYPLKTITLPFNQITLVVQKLKTTSWTIKFDSIPADGCDHMKKGNRITFETNRNCQNANCTWIVLPEKNQGEYEISFPKLALGPTDSLILYKLNSRTPIATFHSSSYAHALYIPSQEGIVINLHIQCSNEDIGVKALVLLKPACNEIQQLSVGESVEIHSPRYPQTYPLNSNCKWQLTTASKYVALRFVQVSLSSPTTHIHISAADKDVSISGRTVTDDRFDVLPDDELLQAPIALNFQVPLGSLDVPVSSGFLLTAVAFDCGGILSIPEASLEVTPTSLFCIWSISVPRMTNRHTHLYIKVFPGGSRHDIKLYDGGSMRDTIIKLNIDGIGYSTGSRITVVYRSSGQVAVGPILRYVSRNCTVSDTCGSGHCLLPEWRCNGVNDCGDYMDELECPVSHSSSPCDISAKPSTTSEHKTSSPSRTSSTNSASTKTETSKSVSSVSKEQSRFDFGNSTTGTSNSFQSTEVTAPVGEDSAHVRSSSSKPAGITTMTLVSYIFGGVVSGVVFGGIVMFFFLRKRWMNKEWKALQCSNPGLAIDNVSL